MKDFRQLQVWVKAHEMVMEIYHLTSPFPKEEMLGLSSQLRRAGVSIPANIAEGCGRGTDADFKRFVQISFGSASEVEYLVFLSFELSYIKEDDYKKLQTNLTEIKKMLASLINRLK